MTCASAVNLGKRILLGDNIPETKRCSPLPVPNSSLPCWLTWHCKEEKDSGLQEEWNSHSVPSPGACPAQHAQHPDCWLQKGEKATSVVLVGTAALPLSHLWELTQKVTILTRQTCWMTHMLSYNPPERTISSPQLWNNFTRNSFSERTAGLVPWFN